MKQCRSCVTTKPLGEFPVGKYKDGRRPICKICFNASNAAKRLKRGGAKRRPHNFFIDSKEPAFFYKYGIRYTDIFQMFTAQKGVCKICAHGPESPRNSGHRYLAVDHCHSTGRVRGLLCMRCNTALGMLEDNPELFTKCTEYLSSS